jgi:hypothetical protein
MTDRSSNDARPGRPDPPRPASQRDLVIQSLILRPDDASKRGAP